MGALKKQMHKLFDEYRERLRKSNERERRFDRPLEAISRIIWPYTELKLVYYISVLAVLDFLSTFIALELSGGCVSEVGVIAKWALRSGGFPELLLVDVGVICILIFAALAVRFLYARCGLKGFSRAAFTFLLIPYFVFIIGVVVNNIVVAFM
jgi:hypothetical protein